MGVAEMENCVELAIADIVASNEVPKPPTGAQRRLLRVVISARSSKSQRKITRNAGSMW